MAEKRTVYYEDFNNDDFAHTGGIKWRPLKDNFKYLHKSLIWKLLSSFLYFFFAVPLTWAYSKVRYNVKVVGAKKLRKAHLKGYFVYGNHTQEADGFLAQDFVTRGRKTYVVCSQDVVSIPCIQHLVVMLGAIPVPMGPEQAKKFVEAIEYRHKRGDAIVIFPEAHIWPYTTLIRDFPDASFSYPAQLNAPVVGTCVTYEERKIFRSRPPRIVLHVSDPFYPDQSLPLGERAHALREQVYHFMVDVSSSLDNFEYIHYAQKPKSRK